MVHPIGPLLALGLGLGVGSTAAALPPGSACAPAQARHSVTVEGPLLVPPTSPGAATPTPTDFRDRLSTTSAGWPRLERWCVWVEPAATTGPGARWDRLWLEAVEKALASWGQLVPLQRVQDPEAAQIRIERRRPPLRLEGGPSRASHGRAILRLEQVQRQEIWRLEPSVTVLLGANQRPEALQATALHEIGHALGLWGHSGEGADVMAPAPGPRPTLAPSARDRQTLHWLYSQPTPFGRPLTPAPGTTGLKIPGAPPGAPAAGPAGTRPTAR